MGTVSGVTSYFDLQGTSVLLGGGGTQAVRELSLYLGTLLGALSKPIYDFAMAGGDFESRTLVAAAIGSIVSFPSLYRKAHLNKGSLAPMKYFVAFQHGFFWSFIVDGITRQMGGA